MTCKKARMLLLSSSNVDLLTPELAEAKAHLSRCEECRTFLERDQTLRRYIKDKLGGITAPATARERVLTAIAERRTGGNETRSKEQINRARRYAPAVVAAVAILLSAAYLFMPVEPERQASALATELIDDHIRYRISAQPLEVTTLEPAELTRWFSSRLDFGVRIPHFDGFTLAGGRLCYLFDRRVALAFYQTPDQWVSLFVLRNDGLDLSTMEKVDRDHRSFCRDQAKGYQVIAWDEKGLIYALVSDRDLLELAVNLE